MINLMTGKFAMIISRENGYKGGTTVVQNVKLPTAILTAQNNLIRRKKS